MPNQEDGQRIPDEIGLQIMGFGTSKVIGWFAFLFPALLLYWFTTSNKPSSIYNEYEINSVSGVCWFIFIIYIFLFLYINLIIILIKILPSVRIYLKRESIWVKFAIFALKIKGSIMNILWFVMILFGYSWSANYVPLKPIIMKMFSYFSMIYFINYYQLTLLCNSYISGAIKLIYP